VERLRSKPTLSFADADEPDSVVQEDLPVERLPVERIPADRIPVQRVALQPRTTGGGPVDRPRRTRVIYGCRAVLRGRGGTGLQVVWPPEPADESAVSSPIEDESVLKECYRVLSLHRGELAPLRHRT